MDIAATRSLDPISESDFARIRLFKGEDISNVADLLEDCPIISVKAHQNLSEMVPANAPMLILLSGRLEQTRPSAMLPAVVTAGEYVGGLHGYMLSELSGYHAIQDCRLVVLSEDLLKSLAMVSHSIAVNLGSLAMEQLKHLTAVNEAFSEPVELIDSTDRYEEIQQPVQPEPAAELPQAKLHDAKWLEELLNRQIIRCRMDMEAISLAVLEIDEVNTYRDKHGDESIPYVSNTVAHTILANVRPGDLVARIDQEHFVVVLPKATVKDGRIPAERLCARISEAEVKIPGDCRLPPVTVSIGIVELKAMIGAEKFVQQGVLALARAREQGSGSISE